MNSALSSAADFKRATCKHNLEAVGRGPAGVQITADQLCVREISQIKLSQIKLTNIYSPVM